MNNEEMNYQRALVFFKEKTEVHITKVGGIYYNGLFLKVTKDYFIIDDKEDGPQKRVFYFELIQPIREYVEEKNK